MYNRKVFIKRNVNKVNNMKAPNVWEGVRMNVRNKRLILRKEIYDMDKNKFLHGKSIGLFVPARRIKRRVM